MTAPPSAVVEAWQAALAAEHAAVFGYGSLGPHLPPTRADQARIFERSHRGLRDTVIDQMGAVGIDPVAARADYPVPFALTTGPRADRYAQRLEEGCAAAWRFVVASAAEQPQPFTELRGFAVGALTASAVRAMQWRELLTPATPTVAFPGVA
jgi:Domain of unknown function (DUF4439)